MSITAPRARRPLASAASVEDQDNYALDTYPQQQQRVTEKPTSQSNALRSRPLAKDNDSLLAASSWIQPDELLAKGKVPQGSQVSRLHGQQKGPKGPLDFLGGGLNLSSGECKVLVAVFMIACAVRLYRLDRPSSVVFDEVHFGGMAGKYIRQKFFMDVHPPLAKLLITLTSLIGGFRGNFDFKDIGKEYGPDKVPYVFMRLFPASLGILVVPTSYLTMRGLACRPVTALLSSLLITFENGLITQSRLILLDSPLIFFTATSIFFWVGFSNENSTRPFTRHWWIWLSLTGLSLGAVVSCKWVGLFTIATIGIATIIQLWELLGDLRVSMKLLFRHFVARAICLLGLPLLVYMACFQVHFWVLHSSGDGDGFMSSAFQHSLKGHGMADTFADVALGSKISIRHFNTQGGYLHSHPHNYPAGSKQQQVTLYPHKDDNNEWHVLNSTVDPSFDPFTGSPIRYIENNMLIRLDHPITKKKLHSHDVRPSVSEVDWQNEVSAYGFDGFDGDANDYWQVEIQKDYCDKGDWRAKRRLRALRTKFRLRHMMTGCYLFSHKVKLPDWGFEQQEVTCNKNPTIPNSVWYIETNDHPVLAADPKAEKTNYKRPSFFSKFKELNAVMWRTNAGLTERHAYDSRPQAWPLLRRGINFWVKNNRQIYLIGNPIVWWLSALAIGAYIAVRGLLILRAKRGYQDFKNTTIVFYDRTCMFLVIGWAMHYLPFFIMQRQLFLHHYFPALYCSILLLGTVFDLATITFKPKVRLQVAAVVLLLALWSFWHWSPLVYAGQWTQKECTRAKWLSNWDFSCADFPIAYADYNPKHAQAVDITANTPDNATSIIEAPKIEPVQDVFAAKLEQDAKPKASIAPIKEEHQQENNLPLRIIDDDDAEAAEPLLPGKQVTTEGNREEEPPKQEEQRDEAVPIPNGVGIQQTAKAEGDEVADQVNVEVIATEESHVEEAVEADAVQ